MIPRCWLAPLVVLAVHGASPSAAGEGDALPAVVIIGFESQRPLAAEVVEAAESRLGELEVELRVEWIPEPGAGAVEQVALASRLGAGPQVVAVVWYVHHPDGQGFLYLAGRERDRLLLRHLAADDSDARPETVALVVHSAVEVLLRGGEIGVAEPPPALPPQPAPVDVTPEEPPPVPESPTAGRFGVDLGAAFLLRSDAQPFNIGFAAELYGAPLPDLELFAGYTFWNTMTTEGENALIQVKRHPMHLGLAYGGWLGIVRLGGRLGFLFDYQSQETRRLLSEEDAAAGFDNNDWIIAAVPELEVEISVARRLLVFLRLGADLPFNRVEYRYQAIDGVEIIESPWAVQPHLHLGLRLWIFS